MASVMWEAVELTSIGQVQDLLNGTIAFTGEAEHRIAATKIDDSLWTKTDGEDGTDLDMIGWYALLEIGLNDDLL